VRKGRRRKKERKGKRQKGEEEERKDEMVNVIGANVDGHVDPFPVATQ